MNDSRIIGPNGQGPEQQLARATNKEELLVADIKPQTANGIKRQLARDGSRAAGFFLRKRGVSQCRRDSKKSDSSTKNMYNHSALLLGIQK